MHWIWATEAQDESQARIQGRPQVVDRLDLAFDRGTPQAVAIPEIEIRISTENEGTLTDNLIALGTTGLVFNSRLRRLLEGLGVDNIEYFDAKVVRERSGEATTDYKVANVIGRVACVSPESELRLYPDGSIQFIDRLVLDGARIRTHRMLRLAEFLQIVVVNDDVKKAAEAARITGVTFYRPEDYVL